MLDKSIKHIGVLMVWDKKEDYPKYALPTGYSFKYYQEGDEYSWAEMQYTNGQVDSYEEALECFNTEFKTRVEETKEKMVFVISPSGQKVATASLWDGRHFGEKNPRIHWVSVIDEEQGRGLAKALMTKLMDQHLKSTDGKLLYLTSQTWSYKALNIYKQFGFAPYKGQKPVNWKANEDEFIKQTREAWEIIDKKIELHKK